MGDTGPAGLRQALTTGTLLVLLSVAACLNPAAAQSDPAPGTGMETTEQPANAGSPLSRGRVESGTPPDAFPTTTAPTPAPLPDRAGPAEAQTPWIVTCTNQSTDGLTCVMAQTLMVTETGQRALAATIHADAETEADTLRLALPHGILLPAGVRLRIDDDQGRTWPIEYADQNGSYALVPLDDRLADRMANGSVLSVTLWVPNTDKPVDMQLSLEGFGEALATLVRAVK